MNKPKLPKVPFCPIPYAAIGDGRLSALDFRVLLAIAYHDRMSATPYGKGRGCFASRASMSEKVGCDMTNFSKSLSRLIQWQYVTEERQEKDARKKLLRLRYTLEDGTEIGDETTTYLPKMGRQTEETDAEIGGADKCKNGSFAAVPKGQYISLNEEIHSDESGKQIPLSGAIELRAKLGSQLIVQSDKAQIAMIERGFKEGHLAIDETYWLDWLRSISDNSPDVETIGWAGRVIETYATSTIDDDEAPW